MSCHIASRRVDKHRYRSYLLGDSGEWSDGSKAACTGESGEGGRVRAGEHRGAEPSARRTRGTRSAPGRTDGGAKVVAWHEDRISGATPAEKREGFLSALADLKLLGAGILVAAKRDRLARDVVVAATIERLVQDAGARIAPPTG